MAGTIAYPETDKGLNPNFDELIPRPQQYTSPLDSKMKICRDIFNSPDKITNQDNPLKAIRQKKESSFYKCFELLKQNEERRNLLPLLSL